MRVHSQRQDGYPLSPRNQISPALDERLSAQGPDIWDHEKIDAAVIRPWSSSFDLHAGKRLIYHIAWNGIPVGSVSVENRVIQNFMGKRAYEVKIVAKSNRFLSAIYPVEDTFISHVSTETITSLRYEADRREGLYRKHVIVEYDMDILEAVYTNLTNSSVKRSPIYENPHDIISAICYFLTLPLKSNENLKIVVNLNEKNYNVNVDVGKVKNIRVPALGERSAFEIIPTAKYRGEDSAKGRARVYVSADQQRYPLYGVVRIPFGTVTAALVKVEDM